MALALVDRFPSAAAYACTRALSGRLYLRRGKLDFAEACFFEVLRIWPEHPIALRLLAKLKIFQKCLPEATTYLLRALGAYAGPDLFTDLATLHRAGGGERKK